MSVHDLSNKGMEKKPGKGRKLETMMKDWYLPERLVVKVCNRSAKRFLVDIHSKADE